MSPGQSTELPADRLDMDINDSVSFVHLFGDEANQMLANDTEVLIPLLLTNRLVRLLLPRPVR
jgi:hypothetical protein